MWGTHSVGSLLRLCLGAALLCVAWVLLSASTADAAERPAPVHSVVSVADGLAPRAEAAKPLTSQLRAATASIVGQLQATTASTSAAGASAVKAVAVAAAPVAPVLEQPVSDAADAVDAVVAVAPLVGTKPIVTVPLPQLLEDLAPLPLPAVTAPVLPTDPAPSTVVGALLNSLARHHDSLVDGGPVLSWSALWSLPFSADDRRNDGPVARGPDRVRSASDTGDPPGEGAPQPSSPSSPMPPSNPGPSQGGGASAGDLAALVPAMVMPPTTLGGYPSRDWPVPRGLPSDPGSRPD